MVALSCALLLAALFVVGCDTPDPYTPTAAVDTTQTPLPFPASGPLPVAGKVVAPPTGAYVGFYAPPAPFPIDRVGELEKDSGKSSAIVMWFQPWEKGNRSRIDTGAIVAIMRRGKVPMITWEPWDPGNNARFVVNPGEQPEYSLARINSGDYDDYITTWAKSMKLLGGPIMLRPMHEMNGTWYPWSGTTNGNDPTEFVTAWRRMHDIFQKEGATNVTWVWSINHESIPRTRANAYAAYYPGDTYVDWTGISGFNRASLPSDPRWTDFASMYRPPLAYLKTLGKPICVTETATLGEPAERAAWITAAYAWIQTQPEIGAVLFFDSEEQTTEPQDWRVENSRQSLAAFRSAIAADHYIGSPPEALTVWASSLTVPQWRYLTVFDPLY